MKQVTGMNDGEKTFKMHCPSCGVEAALTQHFCRACGFSLEKVPQLVAEHSPTRDALSGEQIGRLRRRQQNVELSLMIAGVGFMTLVALSMLSGLIYLMVVGNLPIVPGVVLLVLLLSAIVAGSLGTYSEKLKKTLSTNAKDKSARLPDKESYERPLISVTERTTNLLESKSTQNKERSAVRNSS